MSVVKHQSRYDVETLLKAGLAATAKQLRCLLGLVFLAASSATFSAVLENEEITLDPIPINPSKSDLIFLKVVDKPGGVCISDLQPNGVLIDTVNKEVKVSIRISELIFLTCLPIPDVLVPVGYFPDWGDYEVSIYLEGSSSVFDENELVGSFNLTVRPNNNNSNHEIPSEGSTQSGIGLISGWACDALRVEISIDGGPFIPVAHGTSRKDTLTVCESEFSGYGMVIAWGLLGAGNHRLQTFVDRVEIANVEFEVSGLGEEFAKGLSGSYLLEGFPTAGESVTVEWSEPHQNFIIVGSDN